MVENFHGAVLATLYIILGFIIFIIFLYSFPPIPHPSLSLSRSLLCSHILTRTQPFYVLVDQVNDVDKNETAFSGL